MFPVNPGAHTHFVVVPAVDATVASHTPFPEHPDSVASSTYTEVSSTSHAMPQVSPIHPEAHAHLRNVSMYTPPLAQYASRTVPTTGSLVSHKEPV